MTRSRLSPKVVLTVAGIGLSTAAFAGSQPAAAQSYSGEYACPAGTAYDPTYGCTTAGADDFGYYDYPGGTVLYGRHGHGFGHIGMGAEGTIAHHGMGFRSIGVAHVGSDGFADRGVNVADLGRGGFTHGMGVAHGWRFRWCPRRRLRRRRAPLELSSPRPRASILSSCMG